MIMIFKTEEELISTYLTMLDEKFEEIKCWKHILDHLMQGIILISKKFNIIYKNHTSNNIFGIKKDVPLDMLDKDEAENPEETQIE